MLASLLAVLVVSLIVLGNVAIIACCIYLLYTAILER